MTNFFSAGKLHTMVMNGVVYAILKQIGIQTAEILMLKAGKIA